MFDDAKVTTSKFLQLKDKLATNLMQNREIENNPMRPYGITEASANFNDLVRAFNELCDLLHQLTICN